MSILRNVARILFGNVLPRRSYPVLKGPLKGASFILGTLGGEGGGATVYFNMIEPLQTKAFMNAINKGDIVFDVGANVGYYTVLGSKLTGTRGKVFSFEPFVRNISYLHRHVKLNKLTNVTIIPLACSDSISVVSFIANNNTAMGHIEKEDMSLIENPDAKKTIVATVTLDAVATKFNITPDVLKIDVEGAELLVLHGAKNIITNRRPTIFLSLHSTELRKECLEYLTSFGYLFEPLAEDQNNAMEFFCKVK